MSQVTKKLRITLYLVTAYLALFGVLFLLAPSVASRLTHTMHDPTLDLLYGQYTLTFAFVALMAARASQAASKLSLAILVLTAGHVVVFGYLVLSGIQGFAQAGPPLVANSVLTVLLFLFRKTTNYAS
jgi:hypothetical protein